jgi:hypothetical protein
MASQKHERSFGLSQQDIGELTAEFEKTKTLPNPYRRGSYWYIIEACKSLGLNKKHPLKQVIAKIRELMSDKETKGAEGKTDWQRFRDKAPATDQEDVALDAEDRIVQNMAVLQRVNLTSNTPYGLKLLEVGRKVMRSKGAVIDMTRDGKGALLIALNIDSDTPSKPGRAEKPSQKAHKGSVTPPEATGGKRKAKAAAKRKTPRNAARTPRKAAEAK